MGIKRIERIKEMGSLPENFVHADGLYAVCTMMNRVSNIGCSLMVQWKFNMHIDAPPNAKKAETVPGVC